jgi:hypothetical protein
MLKLQKNNDFNKEITNIFNLLSIDTKYKLIGSSSYKSILFNTDYDLQEIFKTKNKNGKACLAGEPFGILNKIYELFKKKYEIAMNDNNVWITDFKCGIMNEEPIRWNYNSIMKGYQIINNKTIHFIDCILMKATLKLDMIVKINNIFNEFSENYYIKIGNQQNYISDKTFDKIKSLTGSLNEYKNINVFKALKRLFSIFILQKKFIERQKILINFFNSSAGLFYKSISEINLLLILINNNFRPVKLIDIINNLQYIKQNISHITTLSISDKIDKICKNKSLNTIYKELQKLYELLLKHLNIICLEFCKKHEIKL